MLKNIAKFSNCYGCGVCAVVCPKSLIVIVLSKNGFYHPKLTKIKDCFQCGLCLSVCAYNNSELALTANSHSECYAAWSKSENIRFKCSSGGVAFELGRQMLEQGYSVCGVRYNPEKCRTEHFITDNESVFHDSIGSKYLQSYTLNAFSMFKKTDKYFVTGTPCQIDSLRRFIKVKQIEDNFVLLDFFCHGVPSTSMWLKYIGYTERRIGKLINVSWRNKKLGWHDSYVISSTDASGKLQFLSKKSDGDLFYRMFLSDICLGKACYNNCKYKGIASSADIRVGDLWGSKYKFDTAGVSSLIVLTETGKTIIRQMKSCNLVAEPLEVLLEGQMKKSPPLPLFWNIFTRSLITKHNYKLKLLFKIHEKVKKIKLSIMMG